MVSERCDGGEPTMFDRANAVPYIVDMVGAIPGLRINPNHLDASRAIMQLSFVEGHGLTIGAENDVSKTKGKLQTLSKRFSAQKTKQLGFTLEWVSSQKISAYRVWDFPHSSNGFHCDTRHYFCFLSIHFHVFMFKLYREIL
mmetsp:Transcript_62636/g.73242  ORF Transcript_62636/g.73242 Transcript_62636/m.73242 type:complete len:142 (-) Transcript_62636:8-433(-)